LVSARAVNAVLRDLGKRIRAARTAAKLSQEEAADLSAIDYKRFQRIETGKVNVTVKTLVRIAEALGTSFSRLAAEPRAGSR
jgi:transcriptional regulator with XRE-family HTH domain